jgi:hypothetical protein
MARFDRVNGHIDIRVWKERRFENILKLNRDTVRIKVRVKVNVSVKVNVRVKVKFRVRVR